MFKNIVENIFGKLFVKGDLIGSKNGIMVFKQIAKDGTQTIRSFKNFKPFKVVTKKQISDMPDGKHVYTDAKHIFTEVEDLVSGVKSKIVSTKYHVNYHVDPILSEESPKHFISDLQRVKIYPDGKQSKLHVINMSDSISMHKEDVNGKKVLTKYNKAKNGNIGMVDFQTPYYNKTTPSYRLSI